MMGNWRHGCIITPRSQSRQDAAAIPPSAACAHLRNSGPRSNARYWASRQARSFFLYQQHSILSGNALLITSIEPLMMRQYTTPTFGNTSRQLRTEIRPIDHIQISLAILSPHEFQIRFCSTLEPFDSNVTSLLIIDSRGTNEGFNIIAINHSPALCPRL